MEGFLSNSQGSGKNHSHLTTNLLIITAMLRKLIKSNNNEQMFNIFVKKYKCHI